ncbi:MAG: S-layer homology domain-containing protein [Pseudoflavonifractor sp.]
MKKLLSAFLALALVAGFAPAAFAAEALVTRTEAAQVLAALDIMTGDDKGDLQLDRSITRAEFTKLTIAASPYREKVGPTASVAPYPDLPKANWAAPWVQCAKETGLVMGNLAGYFEPARPIRLAEGVTMVLRLLGYQDADFSGAWPSGQMTLYRSLKLDKSIRIAATDDMTREDALWLFYNLLTAKTKAGQVYLSTLGHALTPAGELDRVALINSAMEGPLVAEGSWQTALPFSAAGAAVYRDGKQSSLSAIEGSDIIYWSKPMNTLWAYGDAVTGSIGGLAPSASAPSSVTIAGRTYPIETSSAAYDLSDLGSFRVGDSVTLLLGRSGGVAAVRTPGETGLALCGMVIAIGTGRYRDAGGKEYTAPNLTMTATDGKSYSYQYENKNNKFEPGDLVRVTGGSQVKKLSSASLTGKVSADGKTLGNYTLAPNLEILDTYGDTMTAPITPARLGGVSLREGMVRYYAVNAAGAVDRLILNDVTGDLHQYGVLTEVSELTFGMTLSATYRYDIGGIAQPPYVGNGSIWNLQEGPCQVKSDGQTVKRIYNLPATPLTSAANGSAIAGNKTYAISDTAAVYLLQDKTYYRTDLARVQSGYSLTGYMDKPQQDGGRVRVIVAKAEK